MSAVCAWEHVGSVSSKGARQGLRTLAGDNVGAIEDGR
jgi:hypothetical protein